MTNIGSTGKFSENLLAEIRGLATQNTKIDHTFNKTDPEAKTESFYNYLVDQVKETNSIQKQADKAATDVVSGKSQNIQETMLKATQAELNFNLMVQIRNKALAAYQEIMRMPV